MDDKILSFKEEVKKLCMKYDLTIGHEDTHGAFVIVDGYSDECMGWFMKAVNENELGYKLFDR